jgi:hypothetical protein
MAATARQAPALENECKEHHDWPLCGCDPVADRVVAALLDQGWRPPVDFVVPER